MRNKENEKKTSFAKIEEEFENKKKLPKLEKKKILRKCIVNIIILIMILIYLFLLQIGEDNIQTDTYMNILKICSIILTFGTIVMFEISYKCNQNNIILHSAELLIILFFTLLLIPAYSLYYGNFYKIIIGAMVMSAIYYLAKCIFIRIDLQKKYNKSLIDIKTILEK